MRIIVAAAAVLLPACAGASGADGPSADGGGPMAATMQVEVSGSVRLSLHVTNTTGEALELTFPTSQRYDFVVETAEGEEVWRWSDDMMFLQAISRATLEPGGSWDMEAVWEPGAERSGEYVVTGMLMSRDHDVRQRASFELP